MNDVIHDLTHRAAIRDVNKIISDESVSNAIQQSVGLDLYTQFKPWLVAIAAPSRPLTSAERIMTIIRGNASAFFLGLKMVTGIRNFSSITLAAWKLGKSGSMDLLKFYAQPHKWLSAGKFALENSPELRERLKGVTFEMRELHKLMTAGLHDSAWNNLKQSLWTFLGISERMVSIPIWCAAYSHGMDMFGNHENAVHYADSLIQGTQNTNFIKEQSRFQRTELAKNTVMFYTQMGSVYNMFVEEMHRTGKAKGLGKVPAFARMAAFIFVAHTLQGMLYTTLGGRAPAGGGDDEPDFESYMSWMLNETVTNFLKMYPLVGDAANIFSSRRDYNPASSLEVLVSLNRFTGVIGKTLEKPMNRWDSKDAGRILKSGADFAGLATGMPTRQFMQWFYTFERWLEQHPNFSGWEFIYGSPRKKK
jgi:hypothetical protein